jgi:hypothetical protein
MWHAWGEGRGVYRFLVGRLDGRKPVGWIVEKCLHNEELHSLYSSVNTG